MAPSASEGYPVSQQRITPADEQDIRRLKAGGMNDHEIGARYKVTASTIGKWRRRWGILSLSETKPEPRVSARRIPIEFFCPVCDESYTTSDLPGHWARVAQRAWQQVHQHNEGTL